MDNKKEKILSLIRDENYKPMKIKEIAIIMQVPEMDKQYLHQIIDELSREGKIIITQKGKIMLPEKLNIYTGIFYGNARGFGFVEIEGFEGADVFISASNTNGAINKDIVMCRVISPHTDSKRAEGEIIKVVKRGYNEIIGTYQKEKGFGFVIPDDKKISGDIYISKNNSRGAVTGHKVAVKITKSGEGRKSNEGKITEILGHINDPGVDITSIVKQLNIPSVFSEDVINETEKLSDEITSEELENRKDYRDLLMVTIDGEDTKDLDDAVSLEILPNGNYSLGVHIADVTHYVKEGSHLDKEALKRGTSVYLVDRVIPMLPHKLSNDVCSLNPNVDRLTLSCVMEIDPKGNVVRHLISNSVININKRMSYTVVNDILTNEDSAYIEENIHLIKMFKNMEQLAQILRAKRVKRGAIEFDFPETKIIVDDNCKPIDIKPYSRNIATSIIEEFMLICNETVAEEYYWLELPFVYRSHEEPDAEKIRSLANFVHSFGYTLKGSGTHPGSLQTLLSNIESTPEETIISRVILRSLKQARYTPENSGHFGLAAKYYCHFTSPIRRYPDLQIHRIIKANLSDNNENYMNYLRKIMPDVCKQCSTTERTAESCEREVENLKKVEFMLDKVGQCFVGIISGLTNWGIYVELPNTVEGMISLTNMDDDYYIFNKEKMMYIGERLGKTYSLGDKVKVILVRANLDERNLDFVFADEDEVY